MNLWERETLDEDLAAARRHFERVSMNLDAYSPWELCGTRNLVIALDYAQHRRRWESGEPCDVDKADLAEAVQQIGLQALIQWKGDAILRRVFEDD